MDNQGASALQTGLSPSVEPVPVSPAVAASIPSAEELIFIIGRSLAAKPELLSAAIAGITQGMNGAIEIANARAAQSNLATLSAMALAKGRLSPQLHETMIARIVAAIHPKSMCGYERGYFDLHAQAIEARRAETQSGSVHESAVPQECATTPSQDPSHDL